jgi:heme/copper-type cytochrome/quinol oxidase subunit 3
MSEAAAAHAPHGRKTTLNDPHFGKASYGKIGMWIFLLTDGFGFAGLLIGLAIIRGGAPTWPPNPELDKLGIPFTAVMTFVLILSSVTMVMALAAAQEKNRKATLGWLGATVAGGLFFLLGQAKEWSGLIHEGLGVTVDHFGGTFFVITGFHGLHVTIGVIYLICMLIATRKAVMGPKHSNLLEIAGLFWHFVDLVWILVFTFVYLIPTPPPGANG